MGCSSSKPKKTNEKANSTSMQNDDSKQRKDAQKNGVQTDATNNVAKNNDDQNQNQQPNLNIQGAQQQNKPDQKQIDDMLKEAQQKIDKELKELENIAEGLKLEDLIEDLDEALLSWEFRDGEEAAKKCGQVFYKSLPEARKDEDIGDIISALITIRERYALLLVEKQQILNQQGGSNIQEAIGYIQEAIDFQQRESNNSKDLKYAGLISCKGSCLMYLKEYTKALEFIEEGLRIRQSLLKDGDSQKAFVLGASYLKKALIFSLQNKKDQAKEQLEKAKNLREKSKNPLEKAYFKYVAGVIAYNQGELEETVKHFDQVVQEIKDFNSDLDDGDEAAEKELKMSDMFEIFNQDQEYWKYYLMPKLGKMYCDTVNKLGKGEQNRDEVLKFILNLGYKVDDFQLETFFKDVYQIDREKLYAAKQEGQPSKKSKFSKKKSNSSDKSQKSDNNSR